MTTEASLVVVLLSTTLGITSLTLPVQNASSSDNTNWNYAGGFLKSLLVFRNGGHQRWCFLGFMLLAMCQTFAITHPEAGHFFSGLFGQMHAWTALNALVRVVIFKHPSDIYSVDCAWFNAVMMGIYFLLWYF